MNVIWFACLWKCVFIVLHVQCFIPIVYQVSDEGDVLYVFPKDYRSRLVGKSFRMKIEPWADKAKVLSSLVSWQSMLFSGICLLVNVSSNFLAVWSWVFDKGFIWDNVNCFNRSCVYSNPYSCLEWKVCFNPISARRHHTLFFLESSTTNEFSVHVGFDSDDDSRKRRGGRSFSSGPNINFFFNPADLFW